MMGNERLWAFLILFAAATMAAILIGTVELTAGSKCDKGTAEKLVSQCAGVKEGDCVWISGLPRDIEFLEQLAYCVRAKGAFPLITVNSNDYARKYYQEVPEKYDSQTNKVTAHLLGIADVIIGADFYESSEAWNQVPLERRLAVAKANEPNLEVLRKRHPRSIGFGNGLYPTGELSKESGLPIEKLEQIFWNGVNTDYALIADIGTKCKSLLAAAKEVHVSNKDGTNFKVQIEGRPIFVSDGIITPEEDAESYAASQVWLPAGEVYLAPVPGTANGTIVVDRATYYGDAITGLTLTFKDGKVISVSTKAGGESLKQAYAEAGPEAKEFSILDIGINPNVVYVPGSNLKNYVQSGMLTIGTGSNDWAGGSIVSPGLSVLYQVPMTTLTVDGKVLIEEGKLKL